MANFEQTFRGYALAGLMVVCIIAFGITLQADNPTSENLVEIPIINNSFNDLRVNLEGTRDQAQSRLEGFEKEEPTVGFGSLILFSIVSFGKVFTGIIIGTFNIVIAAPMIFFGIDPVISAVLSTLLIVSFITGLWVLYKLGG